MYFLGISMFSQSHLEVFIVPFICVLYVSISLYPWCLIHRNYNHILLYKQRRYGAEKQLYKITCRYINALLQHFFIYSAHFETCQFVSWQQGAAAATADQSRFQMISRGNTDYFTLIFFHWLHLIIQSCDSVNLLDKFIVLYPISDHICSGFKL